MDVNVVSVVECHIAEFHWPHEGVCAKTLIYTNTTDKMTIVE